MTYTEGQEACSVSQSGLWIYEPSVSRILDYVLARGLLSRGTALKKLDFLYGGDFKATMDGIGHPQSWPTHLAVYNTTAWGVFDGIHSDRKTQQWRQLSKSPDSTTRYGLGSGSLLNLLAERSGCVREFAIGLLQANWKIPTRSKGAWLMTTVELPYSDHLCFRLNGVAKFRWIQICYDCCPEVFFTIKKLYGMWARVWKYI